jgi:hypothetical protein
VIAYQLADIAAERRAENDARNEREASVPWLTPVLIAEGGALTGAQNVEPGTYVKVRFTFTDEDTGEPPPAETMWLQVASVDQGAFVGALRHDLPVVGLVRGDRIALEPRHVLAHDRLLPRGA